MNEGGGGGGGQTELVKERAGEWGANTVNEGGGERIR